MESVLCVKTLNSEMIGTCPWPAAPCTALVALPSHGQGWMLLSQFRVALAVSPCGQGPVLEMAKAAPQTEKEIKVENDVKHNMS